METWKLFYVGKFHFYVSHYKRILEKNSKSYFFNKCDQYFLCIRYASVTRMHKKHIDRDKILNKTQFRIYMSILRVLLYYKIL